MTGNGKFSPDKNTAILQLRLIGNSPGNGPTGAPTEGVGSSTTGALTQPTQGTANPQLQQGIFGGTGNTDQKHIIKA